MADFEAALLEWVTQLNSSQSTPPVTSLQDLSDGLQIAEFAQQMYFPPSCPAHFKVLDLNQNCKTEWPVRLGNLQKLQAALLMALHGLGQAHLHEEVDLLAVAVNRDSGQIIRLLEEVVKVALHCQSREALVLALKRLSEKAQFNLMSFFQTVQEKCELAPRQEPQCSKLKSELQTLRDERDLALEEKSRIQKENLTLQMTNADLQTALLGRSKRRHLTPETIALQLEVELTAKEQQVLQLTQDLAAQQRDKQRQVAALTEELEQTHEKLGEMGVLQDTLGKLRKTIEELTPYKTSAREASEEAEALRRRLAKYEEESLSMGSLLRQAAQLRDQVSKEKGRARSLEESVKQQERSLQASSKRESELQAQLDASESRCKELSAQVDRLMADDCSEDSSICTARPSIDSIATARRNTLTVLTMAEYGMLPRQPSQDTFGTDRRTREYFILTYENAELKREKEKLTQDLAEATQSLAEDTAAQTARLEAVTQVYNQQILTLKDNLITAETALRENQSSHSEETTQLSASLRSTQLQLAALQEEIAQQKAEREAIAQDLSKAFRDKDELTAKYLSCREETLRLHKELAEIVVRSSSLEHEVVLYRSRVEELESKPTQGSESDSVLSLQLESLEIERHTLSLKARVSELEYEVKDKEEWVLRTSLLEAQAKELRNRLVRAKGDQTQRDQTLTQLRREKEELRTALMRERRVLKDALSEVTGTMQEIHGLVDMRGSTA